MVGTRRDARRLRGLTLIEMLVALFILSLVLAVVQPSVNGISGTWRLRGAAHEVESVAQWALNAAASRSRGVRLLYDVREGVWWVQVGDEEMARHRLPRDVRFVSVRFGDGSTVTSDVAAVSVFPDGTLDPHDVTLEAAGGGRAVMRFDRLTGEMAYGESE